jgi:hypothetical protein
MFLSLFEALWTGGTWGTWWSSDRIQCNLQQVHYWFLVPNSTNIESFLPKTRLDIFSYIVSQDEKPVWLIGQKVTMICVSILVFMCHWYMKTSIDIHSATAPFNNIMYNIVVLYVVLIQVQVSYPGTSKLNLLVLDNDNNRHLFWVFRIQRIQVLNLTICWNSLKIHFRWLNFIIFLFQEYFWSRSLKAKNCSIRIIFNPGNHTFYLPCWGWPELERFLSRCWRRDSKWPSCVKGTKSPDDCLCGCRSCTWLSNKEINHRCTYNVE